MHVNDAVDLIDDYLWTSKILQRFYTNAPPQCLALLTPEFLAEVVRCHNFLQDANVDYIYRPTLEDISEGRVMLAMEIFEWNVVQMTRWAIKYDKEESYDVPVILTPILRWPQEPEDATASWREA